MSNPINIIDNKKQIELSVGSYSLKVLGGWKVIINNFSLVLREVDGKLEIKPKNTSWRTQSFRFGKRAKTIASINITKKAKYEIIFHNVNELKVKKSNLMSLSYFQNFIPTKKVQVCIE